MWRDLQDVVRRPARGEEVHGVQENADPCPLLARRERDVAPGPERVAEADVARGTRGYAHEHLRRYAGDAELGAGDAVARSVTDQIRVDVGGAGSRDIGHIAARAIGGAGAGDAAGGRLVRGGAEE